MKNLYKEKTEVRQLLIKQLNQHLERGDLFLSKPPISLDVGDTLIENFINYMPVPFGLVREMPIDNKTHNLLLAVEESSVIAALNKSSKLYRLYGEITSEYTTRKITGQICYIKSELNRSKNIVEKDINDSRIDISSMLKLKFESYFKRGGELTNIEIKDTDEYLVINLTINPLEAMGANLITQICEQTSMLLTTKYDYPKPLMCILSNSLNEPSVKIKSIIKSSEEENSYLNKSIAKRMVHASNFANSDPMRASTHNKGIMNAIDPLLIMTGNDWRANNATIHSFAAKSGSYKSLTTWDYSEGQLEGIIEIPMQLGIVGGATKIHPYAQLALDFMEIKSTEELMKIIATSGLLQNFSAIKALVSDGIIQGHMKLHISNIIYEVSSNITPSQAVIENLRHQLEQKLKVEKKITKSDGYEILNDLLRKRSS